MRGASPAAAMSLKSGGEERPSRRKEGWEEGTEGAGVGAGPPGRGRGRATLWAFSLLLFFFFFKEYPNVFSAQTGWIHIHSRGGRR